MMSIEKLGRIAITVGSKTENLLAIDRIIYLENKQCTKQPGDVISNSVSTIYCWKDKVGFSRWFGYVTIKSMTPVL